MHRRQLSIKEMQVLIAIQEKPLATLDELAKLLPFSKSNIYKIRKNLEDPQVFNESAFRVVAIPDDNNLGLEIIDILITVNNLTQLKIIEKFCLIHPYTYYHGHIFGDINGIYLQFRIPTGTIDKIQRIFSIFKKQKIINEFIIFNFSEKSIITNVKVKSWDIENFSWQFNWDD